MKAILLSLSLFISQFLFAQHFVGATDLGLTVPSQFVLFTNKAVYNVRSYKITYYTSNVDGTTTIASGLLAIPQNISCDSLPMVAYDHGTVLLKSDVPSRDNGEAIIPKVVASTGAMAVAPDYLGLGDNAGLHPYLHAETEATATIDLMRAGREFAHDSLGIYFNKETFVTGYSQGGHAAMATVKYIQENNLMNEFNVVAAGPASGPYNLSGGQAKVLISDQPYSNPGYVVYLLFAMNRVYGNIFTTYSDILKPPYDTLIPPYFDGTYDMSVVNNLLPDTLSGFLRDSVLTNFKNDSVAKNHPLWQALMAQDNYDWTPSFPMELYYCTQDEQVDYHNALDAQAAMQANGANVTAVNKGALDHGGCVLPALKGALNLFLAKSTGCTVGLEELKFMQQLELYPNPSNGSFTLSGFEHTARVKVYSITGQLILEKQVIANQTIHLEGVDKGIYLIKISQGNKQVNRKLIIQ